MSDFNVNLLEENIELLVARLNECRKENELLRSELSSLQEVLRAMKIPGAAGLSGQDAGAPTIGAFAYAEKLQVKQKLVLILQKIEMELRTDQTL